MCGDRYRTHTPSRYRRLDPAAAYKAVTAWETAHRPSHAPSIDSAYGPALWEPPDPTCKPLSLPCNEQYNIPPDDNAPDCQEDTSHLKTLDGQLDVDDAVYAEAMAAKSESLPSPQTLLSPFLKLSMEGAAPRMPPATEHSNAASNDGERPNSTPASADSRLRQLLRAGVSKLRGSGLRTTEQGKSGDALIGGQPLDGGPISEDDALMARLVARMRGRPSRSLHNLRDIGTVGLGSNPNIELDGKTTAPSDVDNLLPSFQRQPNVQEPHAEAVREPGTSTLADAQNTQSVVAPVQGLAALTCAFLPPDINSSKKRTRFPLRR